MGTHLVSRSDHSPPQYGEGDEGDEGHEAREFHCEGQPREVGGLQWLQDEDRQRAEEERFGEEQGREDREPQGEREREAGLRPDQGLDRGRDEGAEVSWPEGLHRGEEGFAPLQEGEGVLRPVSTSCMLSQHMMALLWDVWLSRVLSER